MHTRHSSPFPTSFRLNVLLPFFLQIALDYTHIWCFFFSHAFNWLFSCIYRSTSRYADLEKPKKKKTLSATTSLVSIPNTIKLSMLNSGLLSFGEFYRSIISIELLFVRSFLSLGYFPFIMVVFWHRWHLLINSYTDAISWWSWWANELELELIVNDLLRLLLSTIFFSSVPWFYQLPEAFRWNMVTSFSFCLAIQFNDDDPSFFPPKRCYWKIQSVFNQPLAHINGGSSILII